MLYEKVFVRLVPGLSKEAREDVVIRLNVHLDREVHYISDLMGIIEGTAAASRYVIVAFFVQAVLFLSMSMAMLWMTFRANLATSAWEFGVLRALGLNEAAAVRLYVYEAVCLVLSAFIVGTCIGTITSVMMALQTNALLDMPMTFGFPMELVAFTLVLALGAAVGGCYHAAAVLRNKTVSYILQAG